MNVWVRACASLDLQISCKVCEAMLSSQWFHQTRSDPEDLFQHSMEQEENKALSKRQCSRAIRLGKLLLVRFRGFPYGFADFGNLLPQRISG